MNDFELHKEIERNNSDKELINTELDISKRKWAEYLLKNKESVCSNPQPVVVKKKMKSRLSDFVTRIKCILGLTKRKEEIDGIEAYLRYDSDIE